MAKLFVGNVANGSDADQLRTMMEEFGKVTECELMPEKNYGFVVSRKILLSFIVELNFEAF